MATWSGQKADFPPACRLWNGWLASLPPAVNSIMFKMRIAVWEHMQPAPNALYHAGLGLIEDAPGPEPETLEIMMAHVMMLDALVASPEAAQHLVGHLRRRLVESDPRLAMCMR